MLASAILYYSPGQPAERAPPERGRVRTLCRRLVLHQKLAQARYVVRKGIGVQQHEHVDGGLVRDDLLTLRKVVHWVEAFRRRRIRGGTLDTESCRCCAAMLRTTAVDIGCGSSDSRCS